MTNKEIVSILEEIDKGYNPSIQELELLSRVKNLEYAFNDKIPKSIYLLKNLKKMDLHVDRPFCVRIYDPESIYFPNTVGSLKSLESLDLSNTYISKLPDEISGLINLQNLSIKNTGINEIPICLKDLTNLRSLNFYKTDITQIPAWICVLTNLKRLNLGDTPLTELPETLGDLINLRSLELQESDISNLPETIGKLTNLLVLDLSNTFISELPKSIGNLSNLCCLNLGHSNLNSLSEAIRTLRSLSYLDLQSTEIYELPIVIGELRNLKKLVLNNTHIKNVPKTIGNLSNLRTLDFSNTQIEVLPELIGNLTSLKTFKLNNTQIDKLPDTMGNLLNLQNLNLSNTNISELPVTIGNLSNLQNLNLSNTNISELPVTIGNLSNLQNLNLSNTNISELPETIGNLSNLQELDLSGTNISELPETIGNLSNLQELNLRGTKISELPKAIGSLLLLQKLNLGDTLLRCLPDTLEHLSKLQELDLRNTKINKLINKIGNLSNLNSLTLCNSQLKELPETIGNMNKVQELDLSNTSINVLPPTIGNLYNLKTLSLSGTKIETLPDSFTNLNNLQELDISDTPIFRLPDWIGHLPNIRDINISNNTLVELPESLLALTPIYIEEPNYSSINDSKIKLKYTSIYISDLRLTKQPVSLFSQPRELIQKYYNSEKIELKEVKVIFMGDGGAGKSYTIQRIKNNGYKPDKDTEITHDIIIERWDNDDNIVDFDGTIDFWDFGGQDIYLSMHKCFLTDRSCYVIVLCNRQYGSHRGLMRQARYWLRNIYAFVKDSPILFAVNTWNGQPRDGISLTQLKREYPELNIVDQIVYDAHDSDSMEFNRLTDRICKMAQGHYSYSLQFPVSWNNIRRRLSDEYLSENYILESHYYDMCEEEMTSIDGYYDKATAGWLLNWFNDLGYCLNYQINDDSLVNNRYQILKPQWVIRAMYKIINFKVSFSIEDTTPDTKSLSKNLSSNTFYSDRIPTGVVTQILATKQESGDYYSKTEAAYIIQLLVNLKLAYRLIYQDVDELFIPSLCSDIRPSEFDNIDEEYKLKMEYSIKYQYLPESVIQLLMIKCYNSDKNLHQVWKYGFRFKITNGIILVEMINESEIVIRYFCRGDNNNIYGLHEIRKWMSDICKEHNINDGRDFIIKRTQIQNASISVKALTDAYINNPKIELFYVQDDDIYQGYPVDSLLAGVYGSNYRQFLLKEDKNETPANQNLPEKLSREYLTFMQLENIIFLLNKLVDHEREQDYTSAIQDATHDIISAMKDIHIDDISENVRNQELLKELFDAGKTGDEGKLRQLLSDSNSIAEVLKNTVSFAKWAALLL